ncbi:hypothetical protein Aazo_0497 ['Nostoc azollae' 0708]|jgi:hypothetical protein|uniref:Uncharacterized protein n=1 Tax=Nostoc azollae (strain 0708) TaxID=551115 RepID=D7E0A7_NOSA0|nr:hypothetical protein Aazo_0497 ['Nostoc azollae' 0708]
MITILDLGLNNLKLKILPAVPLVLQYQSKIKMAGDRREESRLNQLFGLIRFFHFIYFDICENILGLALKNSLHPCLSTFLPTQAIKNHIKLL